MAKLFRADAERLRLLGFGAVAHVSVLFDDKRRYCRVLNRFLRHRALGEADSESEAPWDDEKIPMSRTIENVGRATRSERELELIRQQYAEAELEYVEQAKLHN